mgnify:CR=1 FL=1
MSDDVGQALEFKYIAAVFRAGRSEFELKRWREGWVKWCNQHMDDLRTVEETKKAVEIHYNDANTCAGVQTKKENIK